MNKYFLNLSVTKVKFENILIRNEGKQLSFFQNGYE
jgi:hypothetical protein